MASKTLTGTYTAGYTLTAGYRTLRIVAPALIYGTVESDHRATVVNDGVVLGLDGADGATGQAGQSGETGILLTAGGKVTSGYAVFGGTGGRGGLGSYRGAPAGVGGAGGAAIDLLSGGDVTIRDDVPGYTYVIGGTGGYGGDTLGTLTAAIAGAGGIGGAAVAMTHGTFTSAAGVIVKGGYGGVGGYGRGRRRSSHTYDGASGVGGDGLDLASADGAAFNHGSLIGGYGGAGRSDAYYKGGAGGTGGVGLRSATSGSITNTGRIFGGRGGIGGLSGEYGEAYSIVAGGAGGDGGVAVLLTSGGVALVNSGSIIGGQGIFGGYIAHSTGCGAAGDGGIGVLLTASREVDNHGLIHGGNGGHDGFGPNYVSLDSSDPGGTGAHAIYLAAGGSLANSGTVSGGTGGDGAEAFRGDLDGGAAGVAVEFAATGKVSDSGLIVGGRGGAGYYGHWYYGGAGGAGGAALLMDAGGTVTVSGSVIGGAGGAGGAGRYGAAVGGDGGAGGLGVWLGASGTVTVSGTVAGGAGGAGGHDGGNSGDDGGAGGAGLVLDNGGAVTVTGKVIGGAGAFGPAHGGDGGAGVVLTAATLANRGVIEGGALGVSGNYFYAALAGDGVDVYAACSVVNGPAASALIEGAIGVRVINGSVTLTNFGVIAGTDDLAVVLQSATDRLIVEAGAAFTDGAGGAGNVIGYGATLELATGGGQITNLGGGAHLSTVTGIFRAFGTYLVDAGTSWTVSGGGFIAPGYGVDIAAGATLTIGGQIGSYGEIALLGTTGASLIVGQNTTLTGDGVVSLGDGTKNLIKGARATTLLYNQSGSIVGGGRLGGGSLTLVNGLDGEIDADGANVLTINTGSKTISNAGVIEATGAGGLTITGALYNTGELEVTNATFAVEGAVSGGGTALITGGTLSLASSFSENVTFEGAGVLELAQSLAYAGTVSGFSETGTTAFDLLDIAFVAGRTKATLAMVSGVETLTITNGSVSARIKLTGDYTGEHFSAVSDGHGGTLVTDPTHAAAAPPPNPAQAHRFVAAMAQVRGPAPSTCGWVQAGQAREPLLALPRAAL